ncbi:hypothetical protein BDV11DRAFT_123569 [Aspergillus similis]
MMDEIELQLCLSIDPTPIPTPIKESHKQTEKQKRSSQQGQTQQLQILGAKRLAENLGYYGESGIEEAGRGSTHRDISLNSGNGDGDDNGTPDRLGSGEGNDHLGYLQLPPRKKVRTSSAWELEPTCQITSGDNASAESDTDRDKNQKPDHAVQTADGFDSINLSHPLNDPQPPFSEEPGEYMHALIASLQLLSHPHPRSNSPDIPRRPQRFEIYEDPDDMDTDGVGFFNVDLNTAWYLSPDENKENAEEDANGNRQHHHGNFSQLQSQRHRQIT